MTLIIWEFTMKKIWLIFPALWLLFLAAQTVSAQSTYMGFNKNHYYQAVRTKRCPACQLYHAHFSKQDMSGANFRGATLIGATFRGATLRRADFRGAKIGGADFSGADLFNAIWINGKRCLEGSVGYCKTNEER